MSDDRESRIEQRLQTWAWASGRAFPEPNPPALAGIESHATTVTHPGLTSSLSRTVIFNLALTMVGLMAAGLVPFGFNLAVGRGYGASVLGPVSVALGLALFIGQIPGTISGAATKFIAQSLGAEDEAKAERVFQFLLVVTVGLSLLLAVILLILAPVLESTYKISFTTIVLAAALIPSYTLYLYFKSCYYGFHRVRTYLTNEIVSDAAFFAALAVVFLAGARPWLLLPFVLNNAIFSAIALRDMAPHLRAFRWLGKVERREVVRFCLINGGGSAASLGRWSLGTAITGLFLSHHAVGLFAAALAITAPLPLLPRAISLVTFALMARLHGAGKPASVRVLLQQSTEWLVFLLGVPSGVAIINASTILSLAFRPDFMQAAVATQLIIAGAYLTDISRPSIDALSSTLYVRTATVASLLGLATSLAVWLALIPHFGISMAGLGFALGALVTAAIPSYYAYKHIGSAPAVFLRPAAMLAGLTLLTVAGRQYALVASIVFVGGTCLLYLHLLEAMFKYMVTALRGGSRLAENSA